MSEPSFPNECCPRRECCTCLELPPHNPDWVREAKQRLRAKLDERSMDPVSVRVSRNDLWLALDERGCPFCALGFAPFKAEGIMWHQVNGRDPFMCAA